MPRLGSPSLPAKRVDAMMTGPQGNFERFRRFFANRSGVKAGLVAIAFALGAIACSAEPTKSQYVSAVVTQECAEFTNTAKQSCRIEVIKRFTRVSFEEMKAMYPKPEPTARPGLALW
jgi:hypothetical protein